MHSLNPNAVRDRESFIAFVEALMEDRTQADALEAAAPDYYRYGGAAGWQNSSIVAFLDCALAGSLAQERWGGKRGPSWRDFALFLYLGKIYE